MTRPFEEYEVHRILHMCAAHSEDHLEVLVEQMVVDSRRWKASE